MEIFGKVYLVDTNAKIKYEFVTYNGFVITGYKYSGKYQVLRNDKQICVLHTGESARMFDLPYKFVSMQGVCLSDNNMFYHVTTTKKELFLDTNLNVICDCDRLHGNITYDIYKNNDSPTLIRIGNTNIDALLLIDLINKKIVIENAHIEKDFHGCYYIEDDSHFGYLYDIKNGGVLKSLGRQIKYGENNINDCTFSEIEIHGKKYYSYRGIDNTLSILDTKLNDVKIDTKDISFIPKTTYMNYRPNDTYVCVDTKGKYQIYEFGKTRIEPLGEKYDNLTWYTSSRYLLERKAGSRYDSPYIFVNWKGERIDDITGIVEQQEELADGKLQMIIGLYKITPDDKKYAGYYFYNDDFHIATDYYAGMKREVDSTGNGFQYRCKTFDGDVIYLDENFNNIEVEDIIETQTKYPDISIIKNTKTHELTLKKHLFGNTYITAEIPNNYSKIIIPKWASHNTDNRSFVIKTNDEKYILYGSIENKDYVKLCEMDNIAYDRVENQYYVFNKNEEYPVRLVKINKDNKLTVNRHKLKSVFIEIAYPRNVYYFDGNEIGQIKKVKGKVVIDTNLYPPFGWEPSRDDIDKMKEVEPDIYFLDKYNNIIKREDI